MVDDPIKEPIESDNKTIDSSTTMTISKDVKLKLNRFWSENDPERDIRSYTELISLMIDALNKLESKST